MNHVTAITYYVPIDDTHVGDTVGCITSYMRYVDRFIAIENGRGVDGTAVRILSDVYVMNKVNKLMAGAVNMGYGLASVFKDSEYLLFIDNGTQALAGFNIKNLLTDGIASPHIGNQPSQMRAHGSCFCLHKDTFKRIGLWDSAHGNAADQEWIERAMGMGIPTYQSEDVVDHQHARKTTGAVEETKMIIELI